MKQPLFQTTIEDSKNNYSQIIMEPLEQGFGHTLGNSLRRVLLEHIPGAAATSVKISGVNHQFTTLEGLKEDIIELVLNLKQLHFSYQGTEPAVAKLKAIGPGEVKAGQIELPSGVELSNPDFVIANLADKKSKLEFTLTIESGVGYSTAENHRTNTVGVIPLDALFSPIIKVNFKITDTRVGRQTNFDKLILDVWTNGTITAKDAVTKAAEILRNHYQQIISPAAQPETDQNEIQEIEPEVYKITVEELELPTRIANALRKSELGTVKDLIKSSKSEVAKIKNLGGKSVEIVEAALKAKGVEFSGE